MNLLGKCIVSPAVYEATTVSLCAGTFADFAGRVCNVCRPLVILIIFEELPEPRQDKNVMHTLTDMIFLSLCAAVANCDIWTDIENYGNDHIDEFRKYVPLSNGVLSHDTFSRAFFRLAPVAFAEYVNKACLRGHIFANPDSCYQGIGVAYGRTVPDSKARV